MHKFKIKTLWVDWCNGTILDEKRKVIVNKNLCRFNMENDTIFVVNDTGYTALEDAEQFFLKSDIVNWIVENIQPIKITSIKSNGYYKYEIKIDFFIEFCNSVDAMAFKLKFL